MNTKTFAILAVIFIGASLLYWNAIRAPEGTSGHVMTPQDTSEIAQGSAIVSVALPSELSATAELGKKAYDAKCAKCHGGNAAGQNGVAPPLVHKIYEPNHHSDMAFVLAAKNGVRSHHWKFGNMPPVEGLTDGDVKSIAKYIRELQKENGIF